MANIPISALSALTSATSTSLLPIVEGGVTYKITKNDLLTQPAFNAGNVSGTTIVDVSSYREFIFTLTSNVDVTLENVQTGVEYLFWVYAIGAASVTSMTVDGYDLYSVGGILPNPSNNSWNLYRGNSIDGVFILTEIGNFAQVV